MGGGIGNSGKKTGHMSLKERHPIVRLEGAEVKKRSQIKVNKHCW